MGDWAWAEEKIKKRTKQTKDPFFINTLQAVNYTNNWKIKAT